jgi:Argonaute siRNA chaperone (ARC) complex subunit Arb1
LQEKTSNSTSTEPICKSFMEEVVLRHLFVGMKIEATIHKLNCGIWFSDEVLRAFRSFNTYLCNELTVGWKESRAVDSAAAKLSWADQVEG